MAKKKKQEFILNKYFKFVAIVLALAGIGLMFVPALSLKPLAGDSSAINMWQAAFGAEKTFIGFTTAKFGFSFLVLLIPILLAAAGLIPFFIPKNLGAVISLVCFAGAAVLSFMLTTIIMPTDGTAAFYKFGLSAGSILVGITSILGAGMSTVKLVA